MPRTHHRGGAVATLRPRSADLRDEDALRAAYNAHGGELYRFALRQLGDGTAAEHVVQEVFLRAWRAADRFDPDIASLRVWLFAIARNTVVDEQRRRHSRGGTAALVDVDELAVPAPGPAFDEHAVNAWYVEEALARLGAGHRTALVETYLRGRPYDEVAAEQGIPVGTLRSRLFYGLRALRVVMDEIGVEA